MLSIVKRYSLCSIAVHSRLASTTECKVVIFLQQTHTHLHEHLSLKAIFYTTWINQRPLIIRGDCCWNFCTVGYSSRRHLYRVFIWSADFFEKGVAALHPYSCISAAFSLMILVIVMYSNCRRNSDDQSLLSLPSTAFKFGVCAFSCSAPFIYGILVHRISLNFHSVRITPENPSFYSRVSMYCPFAT